MTRKILKILLPTIAGLLLVLICLQLRQTFIERFYENDAVISFQPLFDIELYSIIYLPILLVALAFQFFVTLRVWDNYTKHNSYLHLKLWQLAGLSCLLFGVIIGLLTWHYKTRLTDLILKSSLWTGLAITYWLGNLFTMHFIDRNSYKDTSGS